MTRSSNRDQTKIIPCRKKKNSTKEATINLRVLCVWKPPRRRVCGSLVRATEEQLLLPTQGETTWIYKVQGHSHESPAWLTGPNMRVTSHPHIALVGHRLVHRHS